MKKIIKIILIIIGTISVVLGSIGIILPVLPTTPFLLLAAACYIRASEKLYIKLIDNKYLGKYIKNFRDGNGIPVRAKIMSIILLWLGIGYTVVFAIPIIWVKFLLIAIATTVSIYILSQKNLNADEI